MAYIDETDFSNQYSQARKEQREWQREYKEYERLANNELLPDLDPNLPETSDGSLAASLFKLPKQVVPDDLAGTPRAIDRDDEWVNEFARIEWEKRIIPNANTQAPFERKWKDAVRKSAMYGGVPLITLINNKGFADFVVAYPQDVILEAGKISDYDSDEIMWDVYYTKAQLKAIIKREENERKMAKAEDREAFTTWNIAALKELVDDGSEQERSTQDAPKGIVDRTVKRGGYKITMCFKRGVESEFTGYAHSINKFVRTYTNPDPTGDVPVHYLYCYQDMQNPYGIGICKLAGGTQNVIDYMRQADVLATQIGIRPPILVTGDTSETDFDSLVYAQDALWLAGKAQVQRQELGNNVYASLPSRQSMYQTSLQKMIPSSDTTIQGGQSGDPGFSRTPAGVKMQEASLSVDIEDFKDNLFVTYEAVAKSMLNTHFANKQGTDIVKLSPDERQRIFRSAPELFPMFEEQVDPMTGETQAPATELEVIWDNARAQFDFTVDPEPEKIKDDAEKLEGNFKILEMSTTIPDFDIQMQMAGKKFNKGEVLADTISLLSDNEKILEDVSPEEQAQLEAQMQAQQQAGMVDPGVDPAMQPQEEDPMAQMMEEALAMGLSEEEVMNFLETGSVGGASV